LLCSYWCVIRESFAAERGRERARIALSAKSLAYLDVFAAHESAWICLMKCSPPKVFPGGASRFSMLATFHTRALMQRLSEERSMNF
jgi:hypothetical protein